MCFENELKTYNNTTWRCPKNLSKVKVHHEKTREYPVDTYEIVNIVDIDCITEMYIFRTRNKVISIRHDLSNF